MYFLNAEKKLYNQTMVGTEGKSSEELELEKLVFGDTATFNQALELESESDTESVSRDEEPSADEEDMFFIDEKGDDYLESEADSSLSDSSSESDEDHPVWVDSDDASLEVSLVGTNRLRKLRRSEAETKVTGSAYERRLRNHFEKLNPRPKWAKKPSDRQLNESDDDENNVHSVLDDEGSLSANPLKDILQSQVNYISQQPRRLLPPTTIDIARLADANRLQQSKSAIQSLEFHPTHPLMLSGGYDRTLRIYHIDGKVNPLATSLHVRESPFQTALFHPDGRRVFAGGRRRNLYIWDLEYGQVDKISRMYGHEDHQRSMEKFLISPDGRFLALVGRGGWINILSAANGQWVSATKTDDGEVADISWRDGDPLYLTISSTAGDIYEWDSRERRISRRWRDQGLGGGVTALAETDRWTAVGQTSGIVNIYDRTNPKRAMRLSELEPESLEPNFVVDNLVTTISTLRFSPDGQSLSVASRAKRDAFRLVHVPSFTVFKNWPTSSTPLGKVTASAYSPGCSMLATGNEGGHVRLWSLNYYS